MREDWDRIGEQLLVLRSQAGDPMAFAELVGRFAPRLRYFLRKLLGEPDRVDDALQEVWLDVFQSLSRLTAPKAFRAWLFRIAHDRACRTLRKRPRDVPLSDEAELVALSLASMGTFLLRFASRQVTLRQMSLILQDLSDQVA